MQIRQRIIFGCIFSLIFYAGPLFAANSAEADWEQNSSKKDNPSTKKTAADINDNLLTDILKQMDATYQELSSFQANFDQESETMVMQKRKKSSGKFYFQKPDKMRWLYQRPEKRDIYLVAEKIMIHLPSRKQVLKQTLDQALPGMAPTRLFMGTNELIKSFSISLVPEETEGTYRLRLIPKEKGKMSVENILISIEKKNFLPIKTETHDIMGNRTTLIFSKGKANIHLEDDLFFFQIPADVEVIENLY